MERGSDSQSRETHSPNGTFAPEIRFRVGRKLRKRGGALVRERRGGAAWAWARPEPSRPAPGRFRVSPTPAGHTSSLSVCVRLIRLVSGEPGCFLGASS